LKKKLIEVALPLEAINRESAREKSIRHGHPSTLHLWWARRPLAACRAVLFASLVNDPSSEPNRFPTTDMQDRERQRLFRLIEELVGWDATRDEGIMRRVREEVDAHTSRDRPAVVDPFCGGGSIPLEGQRLGLTAYASDLNPVAVLITKALVELPRRYRDRPPMNPAADAQIGSKSGWTGASGLAADVRYYGTWLVERARGLLAPLYPSVGLPPELGGGEATAIAWIWARSVPCPNPACGAAMPLARTFALCTRSGHEAWVEPIVDSRKRSVTFRVHREAGAVPEGTVNRRGARCIVCDESVSLEYVRREGRAGHLGSQLMAIVVEAPTGRTYVSPSDNQSAIALCEAPSSIPETELPPQALSFRVQAYGMTRHRDLFTNRQLTALATLSDLISEARAKVVDDGGERDYADAVATYLAFGLDKNALTNCTQATWQTNPDRLTQAFSRQALPMTWDYAEANPLSEAGGGYVLTLQSLGEVLDRLPNTGGDATVVQRDAVHQADLDGPIMFCTDPPYYDNIGYADLSDFFYVWLRRSLSTGYPDLFSTLLTPKASELVATPFRFGGDRDAANRFFEDGLGKAFARMAALQSGSYPLTLFYAFKQAEAGSRDGVEAGGVASTGWETMLQGLIKSGFAITGTWPIRTELVTNLKQNVGALASSIVLVCRPRPADAPLATRREFVARLREDLPSALHNLQEGNVAPVDLAQAAIGPGMAVYSSYSKVIEADGTAMGVRVALTLINQVLDERLAEQDADFDPETRWAVSWFEQFGMNEGPYGVAETLCTARNVAVNGLVQSGIVVAGGGKVRLLDRNELPADWNPRTDSRLTLWEVVQHLIRGLDTRGETGASEILAGIGGLADVAKELAYRLYLVCDRKSWAADALAYNALVASWPELVRLSAMPRLPTQEALEM
jgi:putative DNA methylase